MKRHCRIILMLLLLAYGSSLLADSYRCGRKLISTDDSTGKLLKVCGEPSHKDRARMRLTVNGIEKNVSVERWYYKKNSRSLEHIIIIHQGSVQSVLVGGR